MDKKVAIILNELNVIGGIQITAMSIAKVLIEKGFKVDVISANVNADVISAITETLKIKPSSIKFRLIKLPQFISKSAELYLFSKLVSKLNNEYHLTVNAHGDVQPVLADIVYFHQLNVDYNFRGSNLMRKITYMPLWHFRKDFLESLKDSDSLILANSHWTLSEARRFWALLKIEVLHPPIINEEIYKLANKPRTQNIVLTISRLSPDRGIERVIDLSKKIHQARFIVAGYVHDRKYFNELSHQKPNNLFLCPNISEVEKLNLLGLAKVYVNPTPYAEGFGIAVAEGMAAGLVPITGDKGGVRDFVPRKYRFADLDHMSEAIIKSLHEWNVSLATSISKSVGFLSFKEFEKRLAQMVERFE
ncbi:MAG: glycosyltransferase family 4 protein [Nitrososphaerales archaeon]